MNTISVFTNLRAELRCMEEVGEITKAALNKALAYIETKRDEIVEYRERNGMAYCEIADLVLSLSKL